MLIFTCRAAGSNSTADISDVRPPAQSNMGNLGNQPSILAVLSNSVFSCVIATPCRVHKSRAKEVKMNGYNKDHLPTPIR